MHAVVVEELCRSFGSQQALRDVSFSVRRGERFAVLGANGAGKSTLLRIIAGLLRQDSGRVQVAGVDVASEPLEAKRRTGMVAHDPWLYPELTAEENLRFYAGVYGVPMSRVKELLEEVGLARYAHMQVSAFSKGMKQRLSIARALLHEPQVLLLDEPSSGLDASGRAWLRAKLEEFSRRGTAMLIATHHPSEAMSCARGILLEAGRVAASGSPEALLSVAAGEGE
ncbi:MAG: heme ABC exporter ATP-binding protein CcmA [Euryarchaeota archaeon]|nr:heme ABC exporter ATP-binding protein CcmA [Euryarchaeota archaeon]